MGREGRGGQGERTGLLDRAQLKRSPAGRPPAMGCVSAELPWSAQRLVEAEEQRRF